MIPSRSPLEIARVLQPPKLRPVACRPAYWTLWRDLRIRLIGKPTIVRSERERQRIRAMPKAGYYAVKVGRKVGIYDTWAETTAQVEGYPNAKHKKFRSRVEAEAFLAEATSHLNGNVAGGPSRSPTSASSTKGSQDKSAPSSASRARSTSPLSSLPPVDLPKELRELAEKGYTFTHSSADPKGKGKERLVVYCDGSGISNGKVGARAGAGVWWGSRGEAAQKAISERVPGSLQTNNRGELLAVILALEQCPYPHLPLEIRTDSQYTIGCMTTWLPKWLESNFRLGSSSSKSNKWKSKPPNGHEGGGGEVKNADMIKHLLVLLRRRSQSNGVRFKYVPAHAGVEGNEEADRLAKLGAGMPAIPHRAHWLDPELDHEPPSSGPVNIDFELDPDMLMTPDELAAFEIASDEEF